jgi:acyl-CoA synthetase (AMP-forming)/AMP-acid ligase II
MNAVQLLEKQVQIYPEKTALIFQEQNITYRQLQTQSLSLATGLSSLGLAKSDKVAIFLPNIPEYIYSFLGIFSLRAICVPLDFMLSEEEIINFIQHSKSKVLIAQEKKGIDLGRIQSSCPALKKIIVFGQDASSKFISWESLFKKSAILPKIEINTSDHAALFYTSGSTGHPKGVLLTYTHLDNPIEVVEYFLKPVESDSFLCAGVPFSHIGGLDYMLFMLYFGTTLVLMERFHPLEFLKGLEKYKVTIFCIVPSMYVAILSLKEYDKFDLSSLRYAVVFGAPSSPVLLERFHQVCPAAFLLNGWGMTETSAPNSYLPTQTKTKEIANTGKFPPGTEGRIVDENGNALGDEQDGELWIKGKAVMVGYYQEPELTREVLTPEGWLKTGDIARRDKAGRYYIVGRKKEMIKVSGEIVFAPEVEEIIHRHPNVKEVAVIGMPDAFRGEIPKAFIVCKDGQSLESDDLRFFCRQHLAHFKIPHCFAFTASLPKNRVGKVDKEALKRL